MARPQDSWTRRVRRLMFAAGAAGVVWYLIKYLGDRVREAKIRSARERRERELIKSHFTSLLSTLHYTLYALLPTLHPQLLNAYPVEQTSGAIQGLSSDATPESSVVLDPGSGGGAGSPATSAAATDDAQGHVHGTGTDAGASPATNGDRGVEGSGASVADSWASEFRRQSEADEDMMTASSVSAPMSLPTDTMSSPSPPSDVSALHPSPPRVPRSKKELWRDLKVQSITRTLSTVYLLPLLYILTTSQLSVLARTRYLADVKSALAAEAEADAAPLTAGLHRSASEATIRAEPARDAARPPRGWLASVSSFSVKAMGLGEYAERGRDLWAYVPAPVRSLAAGVLGGDADEEVAGAAHRALFEEEEERVREDAERTYLTYSWWILHEGWRGVTSRVEHAVDSAFGGIPLKRELSLDDWDRLTREVRAQVETDQSTGDVRLYDLTAHLLPPSPIPVDTPLPLSPADHSAYLASLVAQTATHIASADARLLLERGTAGLLDALRSSLANEVYGEQSHGAGEARKARLADLLPEVNKWGKAVWEGIPDNGVETLLSLPEYESFAALIFGDWAPQ